MNEFEKYATRHCGINSLKLHDFRSQYAAYVSPTIIEERQLNVATMDVFSRLMMDRIIFLGAPIYDDAANIIQAQLLFLESADPEKDIQIYINSPGGSVTAGLAIYDTMQVLSCDVKTYCVGQCASMGAVLLCAGAAGKRFALPNSRIMIHQPWGGAQGTAADIMKLAMVRVHHRLKREGLRARLLMQVHDELIVECPASEREQVERLLTEEMEQAAQLSVPLIAEAHSGKNWLAAKE